MSFLAPDRLFKRVTSIDPLEDIKDAGFTHVLLDLDNTLLTRDTHEVPDDVRAWLDELERLGIVACILSNNWHHGAHEWADRLGLPIVSHAVKPLPFAYRIAMKKIGAHRATTLCIGDQMVTDVWGAHGVGMKAYMVGSLVETDLPHTLFLRNLEGPIMGHMKPEK
jgi:HAD superfamily phosphatase (TIGR01668 family)